MTQNNFPTITMMDLSAMEPAAARMLVAQDALDLLEAGAIQARSGSYINVELPYDLDGSTPVHLLAETWLGQCPVCALGAVLVATVRRFDDLVIKHLANYNTLKGGCGRQLVGYLSKFFSGEQLDLIEVAFEGSSNMMRTGISDEEEASALDFRSALDDDRAALVKILENVITNGGTFVP